MINKLKILVYFARASLELRSKLIQLVLNYHRFNNYEGNGFYGSLSTEEEKALTILVDNLKEDNGPLIEFGTLFGTTTLLMAEHKEDAKLLFTIDNFSWNPFLMTELSHKFFTERCLSYVIQNCNVRLLDTDIEDFQNSFEEIEPGLVFLDADHSYEAVKRDIQWALQKRTKIICGHDYSPEWPGVMRAVNEEFGSNFAICQTFWWSIRDN